MHLYSSSTRHAVVASVCGPSVLFCRCRGPCCSVFVHPLRVCVSVCLCSSTGPASGGCVVARRATRPPPYTCSRRQRRPADDKRNCTVNGGQQVAGRAATRGIMRKPPTNERQSFRLAAPNSRNRRAEPSRVEPSETEWSRGWCL